MPKVYLIGSLRNPKIPEIANEIRKSGLEVFDDWYAAGPEADDKWKEYEQGRGRNYKDALGGYAATHVFEFDKKHLDNSDAVILVLPAGKSGHMELGYCIGKGLPGFILLEEGVDRWDVMYKFADGVYDKVEDMIFTLRAVVDSKTLASKPGSWLAVKGQQLNAERQAQQQLYPYRHLRADIPYLNDSYN